MRHLTVISLAVMLTAAVLAVSAGAASVQAVESGMREQSVLERFQAYSGQRTPDSLTALFEVPADAVLRQQPLIALSDGSSAVLLAVHMAVKDGTAPGFSLNGATMVSLQRKNADEWLITVLPAKGVTRASLIVAAGPEIRELPITVAPPMPQESDLTEAGFGAFLSEPADVNRDGRTDYLDDYIVTANYLARQRTTGRSTAARRERALQRTLTVPSRPREIEYDPALFDPQPKQENK